MSSEAQTPQDATRELVVVDPTGRLCLVFESVATYLPGRWVVHSATDQAGATSLLGSQRVDVVVSAIPATRGGDSFLEWMRLRYSAVVRIAVSDAPSIEEVADTAKHAHRILSSSTPATDIARWIGRSVAMRDRVESEELIKVAGRMRHIPTMPRIYRQLQAVLANPDFGISEVGTLISRDPGLAVKVLRLVNSAFFGLRREVASAGRAVGLLGAETVMSLVLGLSVHDQFKAAGSAGMRIEAEWGRALGLAKVAHGIAKAEQMDKDLVDASYLGALLHNVGRLVIAENFPDRFAALPWSGDLPATLETEREEFGADHAQLGALLLKSWDLPEPVVEAVAFYPEPGASLTVEFGPLAAVHAAAALGTGSTLELDTEFFDSFGVDNAAERWTHLAEPVVVENVQHQSA